MTRHALISRSSPRSWGCFSAEGVEALSVVVFPTLVGVFLVPSSSIRGCFCLPHARGGVSSRCKSGWAWLRSSPRSWGCFLKADAGACNGDVFPTLVGVFPAWRVSSSSICSLPHARGGVSITLDLLRGWGVSSPRSWGCFYYHETLLRIIRVFPTLVGVFLVRATRSSAAIRLPYARGGVSWLRDERR